MISNLYYSAHVCSVNIVHWHAPQINKHALWVHSLTHSHNNQWCQLLCNLFANDKFSPNKYFNLLLCAEPTIWPINFNWLSMRWLISDEQTSIPFTKKVKSNKYIQTQMNKHKMNWVDFIWLLWVLVLS